MVKMNRSLLIIDLILVVGSLAFIAGFVGYSQPLVIAPIDGLETAETEILFSFDKADRILIDDNLEFTSPEIIYVANDLVLNFNPGVYYWKVQSSSLGAESYVRRFTIESEVGLKVRESDEPGRFDVVNAGNERLNVGVYEDDEKTGDVALGVQESKEVSGTKFIGGLDE